jgi:hypothetical protein
VKAENAAPPAPKAPEDTDITIASPSQTTPARHESKPHLKQKPDPSTRPLVGYSLGSDEVAEERIDTSRIGTRSKE